MIEGLYRHHPSDLRKEAAVALADPPVLLDTVNRRLLRELDADPRITMSALARRIGMSAPAVSERIQRLEQAGVIKIHAARIEDLEKTLDKFLLYGQTITSIVVSTPVPPRTLPINDER
jgi:DNA-binding Lrp family transcriptional regulator